MNLSTVFLYGPSGSGKSTVGKILAHDLGLPYYDTDAEIEKRQGKTIPEIFAGEGEEGFRAYERAELEKAASSVDGVIALGGGALVDPQNRAFAEAHGRVLLLHAPADVLLARLRSHGEPRPLLEGDAAARMKQLLARRAEHYASFPLQLETTNLSAEKVSWQAQVALGMFRLTGMENARSEGYDVRVQRKGLEGMGQQVARLGLRQPMVIVSDDNVAPLYAERVADVLRSNGISSQVHTLPAGEEHKTAASLLKLWDAFVAAGLERGSTVVALGGGVVSDLAGFAAATYMRGVKWVALPTSLLSMVDASLGGKTGADLPQGKNLIGAFHAPAFVLADPEVLTTLSEAEMRSGMAEVVKQGIIGDAALFDLCANLDGLDDLMRHPERLDEIVRRAMAVKVRIIEEDPYEQGRRAELNLGHTIGHALEAASGYELRHGEGVAIGMVAEASLAEGIGLAEAGLSDRIAKVLTKLGLPVAIPPNLDMDAAFDAMEHDKKRRGGKVRFALPVRIGEVRTGMEIENLRSEYASHLGITRT